MPRFIVTPAYGRDYKSRAAVRADLLAARDFILQPDGVYINLPQLPGKGTLNVRYKQNRSVVVFDLADLHRHLTDREDQAR